MAKYPYIVNKDGVWYPSGAEVPEGAFLPSETDLEAKKTYTKTEINRMPVAELKSLAVDMDIESGDTMSGGELKKALIKALGL